MLLLDSNSALNLPLFYYSRFQGFREFRVFLKGFKGFRDTRLLKDSRY